MIHNNQSLLYVSYSWNFRHRLVRLYWYTIAIPKNLNHLQYMQYTVESSHMETENDNLEKDGKGMSMYFLLNMTLFGV